MGKVIETTVQDSGGPVRGRMFLTEYRAGMGDRFGSYIFARSFGEARRKAKRRGLGEKVVGYGYKRGDLEERASVTLRKRTASAIDKAHALVFLATLALHSKAATVRDFMDDQIGVLHQWLHLERGVQPTHEYRTTKRALVRRVAQIERAIPGYLAAGER